jgi:hypothetical protein
MSYIYFIDQKPIKNIYITLIAALASGGMHAQDTLVLRLDQEFGKDASIYNCIPCDYANNNFGNDDEILAAAWTNGGDQSDARGLFEFYFPGSVYMD